VVFDQFSTVFEQKSVKIRGLKSFSPYKALKTTPKSNRIMAGYSGTPLAKKLGIKPGSRIKLINAPDHYMDLFTDLPSELYFDDTPGPEKDLIHFFTLNKNELLIRLPLLKGQIKPDGMIWVSWPKKASKVITDVTEDLVRGTALKSGLVDIKICAVDEIWSGLKLVIPVKDRKPSV